jgi:hypothetical protein
LKVYNGTSWDTAALNATAAVSSFNNRTGAVSLQKGDIDTALGVDIVASTEQMHNDQQADIGALTASILALTSTSAQGEFGGGAINLPLSTTEQVMPFTVVTQSTNTDVFEIGNSTGTIKQAGTYSFISTVEVEDVGANGDVATITFNLRDTTTNEIYYSQSETVEIGGYDRETIPFNSLMVIPEGIALPVTIDINAVATQGGYRIVGFKSVISAQSANASITREHNTLVNRGANNSHPASAISYEATDVGSALDDLYLKYSQMDDTLGALITGTLI